MKFYYLPLFSLLLSFNALAAISTTTTTADDDAGRYSDQSRAAENKLPVNPNIFKRPDSASDEIKSERTNSSFHIDPTKWSVNKGSEEIEYVFNFKGDFLYSMALVESTEVPVEALADRSAKNIRNAATKFEVIEKEYRVVNDNKVIYMKIQATLQAIGYVYEGYYYANSTGSTQFLVYSSSGLMKKNQHAVHDLLNGFEVR